MFHWGASIDDVHKPGKEGGAFTVRINTRKGGVYAMYIYARTLSSVVFGKHELPFI